MSDFSVHDTVIWGDVSGNQVGSNVAAESISNYLGTDLDKSQPNSFEVESYLNPSVEAMEEHQLTTQVPLPTQNRTSNIASCVDSKQGDADMLLAKAVELLISLKRPLPETQPEVQNKKNSIATQWDQHRRMIQKLYAEEGGTLESLQIELCRRGFETGYVHIL